MPEKPLLHLFIKKPTQVTPYTPSGGGGKPKIPLRQRDKHGRFLEKQFKKLWRESKKENENRQLKAFPSRNGHYFQFKSKASYDLVTKSLESIKSGIRLLNVQEETDEKKQRVTVATVYVPEGKVPLFLKKIEDYLKKNTKKGRPKNKILVESIEDIELAGIEAFWCDNKRCIPRSNDQAIDCEIWLRTDEASSSTNPDKFFKICNDLNENPDNKNADQIEYKEKQMISFPERLVIMVKANKNQLVELIKSSDQIAEIRKAKETARFWIYEGNKDQVEWVKDLRERLTVDKESKVSVCLLDTGVNNGHPLIEPVLSDSDCHTINPEWEVDDKEGHGTQMSGLVVYGNLQETLTSIGQINIRHKLESVKLIPQSGKHNKKELYGYVTKQGINRAEIEGPNKKRIVCMAITGEDGRDNGRPSSWSGAIDQISSGSEEGGRKRLLIVSAGNVYAEGWKNYPESNLKSAVRDPAQSWNALTVGAYTDKTSLTDPKLKDYTPVAKEGELSPFSTTSFAWGTDKWPIKPDIVLEGGNIAKNKEDISEFEDLSLLSLHHKPQERQFEMVQATSAATAQASWLAAQIQVKYPEIWPETIRALIVHSSKWKEAMKDQFYEKDRTDKQNYEKLLRIFGYGVPDLNSAISSYKNSLTLVSEQTIQPFIKKASDVSTKDMHFYKMPWPVSVLKSLPDQTAIRLRFTLSYFVEPGPGKIGWKDKYRYPSYGLRFSLKKPQETDENFKKRINKAIEGEEEDIKSKSKDGWMFGQNQRNKGSIHSDIWEGTAQDIAECNTMAVYPTIGWWRERSHLRKVNKKARYSLIVSLATEKQDIDLYTSVATQIGIPITT